ncbi:MAG: hypothetical protein AB7V46_15185 [Thermomicrobiales bacterium]
MTRKCGMMAVTGILAAFSFGVFMSNASAGCGKKAVKATTLKGNSNPNKLTNKIPVKKDGKWNGSEIRFEKDQTPAPEIYN